MRYYPKLIDGKAVLLLALVFTAFTGCAQDGRTDSAAYGAMLHQLLDHSVPEMLVDRAAALNDAYFVDARERAEFDVSHIENAVWSGYDDFDIRRLGDLEKSDTIVVYCSVGYRSEKVAEKLIAAGYLHVWNLYGGIFEWVNRDQPVVDPNDRPTEAVHAYDRTWGIWLRRGKKVYK